jgi:flagellar biosynthetic protein FliR
VNVTGLPPGYFEAFFLVLVRVGAAIGTMPVVSSRNIPVPAKIGAAALLAFVLTPTAAGAPTPPKLDTPLPLAIGQELLVGVVFGFVVSLVYNGIQIRSGRAPNCRTSTSCTR